MKLQSIIVAGILIFGMPRAVSSGDMPCECCSTLRTTCSLRVSVCPQGDFERIADGCGGDSDFIEVIVRGEEGNRVGIPVTDFWMNACDPEQTLYMLPGAFVADAPTDSLGRTTFSGTFAAGGCILTGGMYVACQGVTFLDIETCTVPICIDIVIVSPDLNADGFVNLSDLSFFSHSYNHRWGDPEFDPCTDYNDDDWCNLSDFSFLWEHYQHECQ